MGSRGPLPRPGSSESLRGRNTLHKRTSSPGEEPQSVEPPGFVTSNPRALAYWQEVAPALLASKRLKPEQAHILGVVCEMAGEVRLLSEAVAAEGLLIEGPRGPRPNPRVRLLRDARRDLLAAARGFGLDTVSDARLPADRTEPYDPDAELLAKYTVPRW